MQDDLLPIDHLFAQKFLPQGPAKASFFLASLLKSAREGHLCISLDHFSDHNIHEGAAELPPWIFEKVLVKEGNRYYLKRNWECEQLFLKHLKRLKEQKPALEIPIEWLNQELEKTALNREQKQAIQRAASRSLTLITGGPGTGKTFTAATLIRLFHERGAHEIIVAAPTGKATANMRHSLGELAEKCTLKTLHALLTKKKLHADLIVVDEGSMVDAERMASLLSAVKEGSRLILLGDKDQLPPIESGNFFADLAQEADLVAELHTCLRTELQEIIELAQKVRIGISIPTKPLPDVKTLLRLIIESKMHVLTPLRKGPYGVEQLNQQLFREHRKKGDKNIPIMIMVNDPYSQLFNGDVGMLVPEEKCAYFPGGRKIPEYLLPRYEFAYVLSVHKSQGSEYEKVMILLPPGSEAFGREMLYTALTRAKRGLAIYSQPGILEALVKNSFHRTSRFNVNNNLLL